MKGNYMIMYGGWRGCTFVPLSYFCDFIGYHEQLTLDGTADQIQKGGPE